MESIAARRTTRAEGGGAGAITAGAGETTGATFGCPQAAASTKAWPHAEDRAPVLAASERRRDARVFTRS